MVSIVLFTNPSTFGELPLSIGFLNENVGQLEPMLSLGEFVMFGHELNSGRWWRTAGELQVAGQTTVGELWHCELSLCLTSPPTISRLLSPTLRDIERHHVAVHQVLRVFTTLIRIVLNVDLISGDTSGEGAVEVLNYPLDTVQILVECGVESSPAHELVLLQEADEAERVQWIIPSGEECADGEARLAIDTAV